MAAIVALIGLFFGNTASAQHRGYHHPHRGYYHQHHRGYYGHSHYRHHPAHRYYRHHGGATVRVNVPVPRPPRVIVRP